LFVLFTLGVLTFTLCCCVPACWLSSDPLSPPHGSDRYINESRLKGNVVPEKQEGGATFEGYMMVDPDDDTEDYE
jgi:hypothetical protein